MEAIHTLFYEHQDLLFLAKTSLGKSLIFQLMLFIVAPTGVVIILISLKLLQEEQNILINYLPYRKVVILTDKNNQKNMQRKIANENYTHVFISPKIALSKKFKENVLNNPSFMACLSLLPIDEIHLVEQ